MSLPDQKTLINKIRATQITYPDREHGVGITGSPFVCNFNEPVPPRELCDEILTADDPWRMFGVKTQLAPAQTDSDGVVVGSEYWKIIGTLFHVEDDEVVGASEISAEITDEWMRIYVKSDCSPARAAEFIQALDTEYGVSVEFVDETIADTGETGDE